jgi:hypothetical protein
VGFTPFVLERTTFTVGDSLDQVSIDRSENLLPRVVPDPFQHPSWLAVPWPLGDVLQYETAEELVQAMHAAHPRLHYIEAQYHRDITMADMQEVIFLEEPPSEGLLRQMHDEIRQRLTEKGIPYQEAWKTKNDG